MRFFVMALAFVFLCSAPFTAQAKGEGIECGRASWYALPGARTASGEKMNPDALSAAHRSLPIGSVVTVRNLANGKEVAVRINDRGPYADGRIIDLSRLAARKLGFIRKGTAPVAIISEQSAKDEDPDCS